MLPLPLLLPPAPGIVIEGFRPGSEAKVSATAMRYLPFDVPAGVTRITIRKELDHGTDASAGRIVDHGLFDPGGLNARGFRGWMGGNPADIVVTGDEATTSSWFYPGPLPAGQWNIAQYYLQGTPSGVRYRYTIAFEFDGPKPPSKRPPIPAYRPGTLRSGPGWYAGNLHAHSNRSDGAGSFETLARTIRDAGFDFFVSTEHNTARSHWDFARVGAAVPDLLLIPGDEFTSPYGHANIYGSRPGYWFDFRFDAGQNRLGQTIREAHRQGGVFVGNHPFALCTTCPWRYPENEWRDADGVEVWNGKWDLTDEQAVTWWDGLLRQGRRLNAYGGTDYHRPSDPLSPATRVWAPRLESRAIMEGLRKGHTTMVRDPRGPSLELTVGGAKPGDTVAAGATTAEIRLKGAEGLRLILLTDAGRAEEIPAIDGPDFRRTVPIDLRGRRFVRAELRQGGPKGEMVALTNAIFVR